MIVGITMHQQPSGEGIRDPNGDQTPPEIAESSAKEANVNATAAPYYESTTEQYQTMPPHDVNGTGAPPSQVYVSSPPLVGQPPHPAMVGLEAQFQQFSLQHNGEDQLASSGHNDGSDTNNTEDYGGDEGEDDPVKLFVGQVPKNMNEEDIFPTFDAFGPLKDVAVIRDKHTGIHRGCAFVTYWSSDDADRAREALHDKFTFPGAKRAAQVKTADPSATPENKLFIGMLSRKAGEDEVRELFSPYGEIREIYMIRNADGSSKCAAFLRYANRSSAVQAIEALNGNQVMEGAARPLMVKFADNKHQRQQRHMRSIRKHEMMAMVGPPGGYPYHPQGPPGMGMPVHPGAGPQYPMHPSQYGPPGYGPGQSPHPYMYPPQAYGPAPPYPFHGRQDVRPNNPRPREGPAGANLFVYHLPHDLTDADLATAFNPFGNVISAKVYVDRYTGESKGFGFVSYDSVMSAEQAIEQMNGFQIGNKRLKVQHKRVHGSNHDPEAQSPPPSGDSSGGGEAMPSNG